MKTLSTTLFLVLFGLISFQVKSQSLNIQGNITDQFGTELSSNYILFCGDGKVYLGTGTVIKERLALNQTYTIIFSKPGYNSKTISVSTDVNRDKNFSFRFTVSLEPSLETGGHQLTQTVPTKIFYDEMSRDFNYTHQGSGFIVTK